MRSEGSSAAKKTAIVLTAGSRVQVRSAGSRDEMLVTEGTFRGLVSLGGDNSLAVEVDHGDAPGRIRLVPLNALLAIDILEAAKLEEEKRQDPQSPGYFR